MSIANLVGAGFGIGFIESGIVRVSAGISVRKIAKSTMVEDCDKVTVKHYGIQKICGGLTEVAVGMALTTYNVSKLIEDM